MLSLFSSPFGNFIFSKEYFPCLVKLFFGYSAHSRGFIIAILFNQISDSSQPLFVKYKKPVKIATSPKYTGIEGQISISSVLLHVVRNSAQ